MLNFILAGVGLGFLAYELANRKHKGVAPPPAPPRSFPVVPAPSVQPPDSPVNPPERPMPGIMTPEVEVNPGVAQVQDTPDYNDYYPDPGAPDMNYVNADPSAADGQPEDPGLLSQLSDWWDSNNNAV